MLIILKWWLFATLAQAALLEISIDGEAVLLEADATDVDAKVASIADRLPQLEGSGCSANDGACVRSVVAAALRNAVAADPMPRPEPSLRAVADEWSTLPKAVGHDKTSSPAEPEAPQDLSLEFVSPAEHELVPCGWLYPRISFLMSNHRRATRAWQYCAAVADADGRRLTQRCAPFGTNSLHGHLIEEAGNYTLEAWIFHTELGGTNVSRRPFACAFVDRVEETPLPEVPPLDCDRMFSNETGLGHLRRAERDGGTDPLELLARLHLLLAELLRHLQQQIAVRRLRQKSGRLLRQPDPVVVPEQRGQREQRHRRHKVVRVDDDAARRPSRRGALPDVLDLPPICRRSHCGSHHTNWVHICVGFCFILHVGLFCLFSHITR